MDEQLATHRRRKRKPAASGQPAPGSDTEAAKPEGSRTGTRARRLRDTGDAGERGLRDLVGAGRSQLGVSGALRGRDVDRPTEEDLAEAEQNLIIVRRNWSPPSS